MKSAEEWANVFASLGMTPDEIRDFHKDWLASVSEAYDKARKQALEDAARICDSGRFFDGGQEVLAARLLAEGLARAVRALATEPAGERCRCTHEAGDSECPVHPICADCNVPTNGEALCPRCKAGDDAGGGG